MTAKEAARHIVDAHRRGEELASVLSLAGRSAGQRVLVTTDGSLIGTFGDATQDAAAQQIARNVYQTREPHFDDVFFAELHAPAEALVIFGAGHIAQPLAELGARLGFSVTVLDDREEFASQARFADPIEVRTLDYARPLQGIRIDALTYVVLVTRAHKYDFDCLRAVLGQPVQPRYIGMIGSRRRVRAAFTALLEGGIPREKLDQVHAPVGIDIGAETPAEIAVSIAAELIRVRRGGTGAALSEHERVAERFFAEPNA